MTNLAEDPTRPVRFCPVCKQADADPKHLRFDEDDNIGRHMDCCASEGCGICQVAREEAGSKTGAAFLKHLQQPAVVKRLAARAAEDDTQRALAAGAAPISLEGADR